MFKDDGHFVGHYLDARERHLKQHVPMLEEHETQLSKVITGQNDRIVIRLIARRRDTGRLQDRRTWRIGRQE